MLPLILASQSPRRFELLSQFESIAQTVNPDIDETPLVNEKPADYVARLAQEKALEGQRLAAQSGIVLAADTIVVCDDQLLGKPSDENEFKRMMQLLSGDSHYVLTAVCVTAREQMLFDVVSTEVRFCELTESDIQEYWNTGEPQDKAGGYGIQGLAAQFVESINGSYTCVVGLPLVETKRLLQAIRKVSV